MSTPPPDPKDAQKRIDSLRAALNQIAYSRWSTETPGQFVEVLQKMARDALIDYRHTWIAPAPAAPVVWQQTTADGEPLWDYDNFLSTPEHFDYSRPLYANPVQATSVPADDVRDAERYRWLRQQHWNEAPLAVVVNPKLAIKLGHDVPSLERLDEAIDAAIEEAARLALKGKT